METFEIFRVEKNENVSIFNKFSRIFQDFFVFIKKHSIFNKSVKIRSFFKKLFKEKYKENYNLN